MSGVDMRKTFIIAAMISSFFVGTTMVTPAAYADPAKSSSKSKKSSESKPEEKKVEEKAVVEETPAAEAQKVGYFSDEQTMLNNQAVTAVVEGNYKKAEQLFTAMIQIGEFDVIWWNLGNTYAAQNRCIEAREAFSHVADAPATADYAHEDIMELMAKDSASFEKRCSAPISISCVTPDMTITIDGGKEFACNSDVIKLTPGAHSLYAQTSFGFTQVRVDAKANELVTVPVEVINYEEIAANGGLTPEEKAERSFIFKTVGWSLLGVGVAVAAGGGVLLGISYFDYKDKSDSQHKNPQETSYDDTTEAYNDTKTKLNISYGLLAGGGALAATGAALLIVDAVKYSDNSSTSAVNAFPIFTGDTAGMGVNIQF